jgi:hypothetical protein
MEPVHNHLPGFQAPGAMTNDLNRAIPGDLPGSSYGLDARGVYPRPNRLRIASGPGEAASWVTLARKAV